MKLLTIAIPTYNRLHHLMNLIDCLSKQRDMIVEFDDLCNVVVFDNASDWSKDDHDAFDKYNFVNYFRHSINIGADANIRHCAKNVMSRYLWIIGDDDLVRIGVINLIFDLLKNHTVGLVYMRARWLKNGQEDFARKSYHSNLNKIKFINATSLALIAGSELMFISSLIFNRELFLNKNSSCKFDMFNDTAVPHLAWIFDNMNSSNKFALLPSYPISALASNSGGYNALQVFTLNYPHCIFSSFKLNENIKKALIFQLLYSFIPGVLVHLKYEKLGKFDNSELLSKDSDLIRFFWYRVILMRIQNAPILLIKLFSYISKCIFKILNFKKKLFNN